MASSLPQDPHRASTPQLHLTPDQSQRMITLPLILTERFIDFLLSFTPAAGGQISLHLDEARAMRTENKTGKCNVAVNHECFPKDGITFHPFSAEFKGMNPPWKVTSSSGASSYSKQLQSGEGLKKSPCPLMFLMDVFPQSTAFGQHSAPLLLLVNSGLLAQCTNIYLRLVDIGPGPEN